jgi:SAM-dependent methyltransferase
VNRYDEAYFRKWYRDPRTRVHGTGEVRRKAHMALAVAEYLLQRPVRSVLDVGCGEGAWLHLLREVRPRLHYTGIDPSEYAVRRYGKRRNLRLGSFDTIADHTDLKPADLVVCSDMLNYLSARALRSGLEQLHPLVGGVAYLELYAAEDGVEGDTRSWKRQTARYYRRMLEKLGYVSCGVHCYVTGALLPNTVSLERANPASPIAHR